MAKSITLQVSGYDGRYMELVCTQTSNGSAKNSSKINWTLSTKGGSVNLYATGPTKVVIDGMTVYSKDRVSIDYNGFPVTKGSVSGEIEVKHDSNGDKKVDVSLSTAIYYRTVSEESDRWTLDSIPRYAKVTHSLHSAEETSVKVNWASDSEIDSLSYNIDNGELWVFVDAGNGKSGTYTIKGLEENTAHKIITRVRRKDSQLFTKTSALSVKTYDYPHCIETPDFVIGNPITLKFYNPLRRKFSFQIVASGVVLPYLWEVNGTTYTGIYAENVQTQLYNTIPNSKYGTYEVVVTYGDVEKTWVNENRYYIDESKCTPVFRSFNYYDSKAVAGDDLLIVESLSRLFVKIGASDKAAPVNGASMKRYVITCDTLRKEVAYSDSDLFVDLGSILAHGARRLSVRAYDSRGIFKEAFYDVDVIEYAKPVVEVDAQRLNNFEAQTTIRISGKYSSFGAAGLDHNGIASVKMRVREEKGAWGSPSTLNVTYSAGAFTCDDVILSLDNGKAYDIEVVVTDRQNSTTTVYGSVGVGQSVFFVSSNKKACYVNGTKIIMYDVVDTWGGW